MQHPEALRSECPDEHSFVFNELLVTSARYHKVLITFGFKCGGKQTKTGHNETKNKKAKSKNSKMNTRSIGYDPFNSHGAMNFHAAHRDD